MLRNLFIPFLTISSVALAAGPARAQGSLPPGVQAGLDDWRAKYGNHWRLVFNEKTDQGRMLFGGGAFEYYPSSVAQGYTLSRAFLDEAADIFGIEASTLVNDRNTFLPLAASGGVDKVAVRLRQEVGGVPVEHGWVDFVYEYSSGILVAIDVMALPGIESFARNPTVTTMQAEDLAASAFESETGEGVADLSTPSLVIAKVTVDGEIVPTLAWKLDVASDPELDLGSTYQYTIAATGTPAVIQAVDRVSNFAPQVGGAAPKGKVKANVTEDGVCCEPNHCCWLPDQGSNTDLELMTRMKVERINPSGASLTTNANGEFTLPGGGTVRLRFEGPHVLVENSARREANPPSLAVDATITSGTTVITMNPSPSEIDVAQANAFFRANQTRAWVRAVNPQDTTMDTTVTGTSTPYHFIVNHIILNDAPIPVPGPFCNSAVGFYNPYFQRIYLSVGDPDDPFLPADPVCSNSSTAAILWHELGHWLNDRYDSTNVGNWFAFGEGIADVFALYQMDYHKVAFDEFERDGDNTNQHLGDCEGNPGYAPNVAHVRGQPLMGAFWKVRKNLKFAHGDALEDKANALFLGWMNAFDQDQIHSIIERQLLVLDDNDHNIDNETPNFVSIERAFTDHGFAPLSDAISICQHAP